MRVLVARPLGRGDAAPRRSSSTRLRARLAPRDAAVHERAPRRSVADRQHRVERGHRLLEDHRDPLAADLAQLALGAAAAGRGRRRRSLPPTMRRAAAAAGRSSASAVIALAAARLADERQRSRRGDRS